MYLTEDSYAGIRDEIRQLYGEEDIDFKVKFFLYLNERLGLSYKHSPLLDAYAHKDLSKKLIQEVLEEMSNPVTLKHPEKYCHNYFFAVPRYGMEHPYPNDTITQERVRDNLSCKRNDLYLWSTDLVSLLIQFYDAENPISFYAVKAEDLYAVHKLQQVDLVDTDELTSTILTSALPAGVIAYTVPPTLYTFLICLLGLCYGAESSWESFYKMFLYVQDITFSNEKLPISHIFKEVAYNMLPYAFPVEETYEHNAGLETRYKERLPYLAEAYNHFIDCHCVNVLFKNAVRDYTYTIEEEQNHDY